MSIILVSALLLLSAAFLVCRLLKKKSRVSIFIYQVGLVIIAFAALLTDNVLLTCCIAAICVRIDRERRKFQQERDDEDQG
jgi:hypothetical protein